MLQEFYMHQKDTTQQNLDSMKKVFGLILNSMPPKVQVKAAANLDKFVERLAFAQYIVIRDYDRLVVTPKSKFCREIGYVLRNTSLIEQDLQAKIDEANATREALPSLMKAAVEPEQLDTAINVSTSLARAFADTFTHLLND